MRYGRLLQACGLCGLLFAGSPAPAQDAKPADPGTTASTFRSYIVADGRTDPKDPQNRTGKQHDLIDGNGLNPVIAVFASVSKVPTAADDPLAKLVTRLKKVQSDYKADQLGTFVVFTVLEKDYVTDEKADKTKEALEAWAKAVPPGGVVLGLAKKPDGKDGPAKNWNLAPETVTVVFYNRHKVLKRWELKEEGLTDAMLNDIAATADQEMKKK